MHGMSKRMSLSSVKLHYPAVNLAMAPGPFISGKDIAPAGRLIYRYEMVAGTTPEIPHTLLIACCVNSCWPTYGYLSGQARA